MNDSASMLETLAELESRHDDLLERLDSLDKQVAKVLNEYRGAEQPPTPDKPHPQ